MVRWDWDWYTEDWRRTRTIRPDGTPTGPSGEGSGTSESGVSVGPSYSPQEEAPGQSPMRPGAFLRLPWRRVLVIGGAVVGLVVQMVLIQLAWELWDLSVSLMEVWAELARKHLEIMLSE